MSFAHGTQIASGPTSHAAIQEIQIGDKVYAANINDSSKWGEQSVSFSSGSPAGYPSLMVHIIVKHPDGETSIIVTPDQPLMLATKEMKRARSLPQTMNYYRQTAIASLLFI